ncbi:MAG: hypothetical protein Q9217_003967 [Psora testacea]
MTEEERGHSYRLDEGCILQLLRTQALATETAQAIWKGRQYPTSDVREKTVERGGVFEFTKLPGEIRNMIYADLLNSYRHLHELQGRRSDFIETSVLRLNKAISTEASTIWFKSVLTICIGPADTALYQPALHRLAGASRFKRLVVDIELNSQLKLVIGPTPHPAARQRTEPLLEIIHRISVQLSRLPSLQEFTLRVNRLKWFLPWPNSMRSYCKMCPDNYFQCLHAIKGLQRVKIEGDLNEGLAMQLVQSMTRLKRGADAPFTLDGVFVELVQQRCLCMDLIARGPAAWTLDNGQ